MRKSNSWEGASSGPIPLESLTAAGESGFMKPCCSATIHTHAHFNPMMVCQECKHLIKCFTSEAAYRNYLTFCKSRGRQVVVGEIGPYRVVVFKTYEPFR